MKSLALIAALILSAASALAVEPNAVISGPTSAAVGDLCVLKAQGSQYDAGGIKWVEVSSGKMWLTVGDQIAFASGTPCTYECVLVCAGVGKDGLAHVSIASQTVVIGGQPTPPTPPGPNPPPVPVPSKFGLDTYVSSILPQVPAGAQSLAPALAANFRAVAAGITKDSTAGKIIADTNTLNVATEGTQRAAWQPFFASLLTKLNAMAAAGTVVTWQDHVEAWTEIAAGLSPPTRLRGEL